MSRLFLVRHGLTRWSAVRYCGRTDLDLSSAGRRQAIFLAHSIAKQLPERPIVHTSPARRARATAVPIAATVRALLMVDDRLQEVDFGRAEGLTFAQLRRLWPDLARRLGAGEAHVDWPHGERATDLLARVRVAWRSIQAVARERDVIVVSHGGPLRVLSGLACGASRVEGLLGPGAVIVLKTAGARWVEVFPTRGSSRL